MKTNPPLSALRHHVTGAIERGEKTAIVGQPAAGEAEHTPRKTLPWRVEPDYALATAPMFISIAPFDHNGSGRTLAFAEKEEAEFIVNACNVHAALVQALEWIAEERVTKYADGVESRHFVLDRSEVARIARAALQSAKE